MDADRDSATESKSQAVELNLLYQDHDLIVLDKPSGLLSVPGKKPENIDSLQQQAKKQFPSVSIVHRLDMATSGLMIMALNKASHRHISKQFELRQVSKTYHAQVFGHLTPEQGSVQSPLIADWPNRPRQKIDFVDGKAATTHWQVLQRTAKYTLVALTPITGRSHQLRVHMLSIGHPILGDDLYAHAEALAMSPRLQLHACYIGFMHPSTQLPLSFYSAAPFN